MKPPKSGARKAEWFATAAAATALIWAALGLLWAQVIVLPEPLLLPPPSFAELLGRIPATPASTGSSSCSSRRRASC